MSNVDLKQYLPECYKGIIEMEALQDGLSIEINKYLDLVSQFILDQFIQTCSEKGIVYYENIFNITADPLVEDISFRRVRILNRIKSTHPPYTIRYLYKLFDNIIGEGNYKIYVDLDTHTLIVESVVSNKSYYHEIQVTITNIKPCNLIFLNKPTIPACININEQIEGSSVQYNYILDGAWSLGDESFESMGEERIYKMAGVNSIQEPVLQTTLENLKSKVTKALINDSFTVLISSSNKVILDNLLKIDYNISSSQTTQVTDLKLTDDLGVIYFHASVYIPLADNMNIVHNIRAKEGTDATI